MLLKHCGHIGLIVLKRQDQSGTILAGCIDASTLPEQVLHRFGVSFTGSGDEWSQSIFVSLVDVAPMIQKVSHCLGLSVYRRTYDWR